MSDEVMKADDAAPDYRKAMLYHSDRADEFMGQRDEALTALAAEREKVARLVKAVNAEIHARQTYEITPTDRGGRNGPKGRAMDRWLDARADVCAALASVDGAHEAPLVGLFNELTGEQKAAALTVDLNEAFGPDEFRHRTGAQEGEG